MKKNRKLGDCRETKTITGGRLTDTDRSGSGDLESQDSRSPSAKNPGTFVPGFDADDRT